MFSALLYEVLICDVRHLTNVIIIETIHEQHETKQSKTERNKKKNNKQKINLNKNKAKQNKGKAK